MQTFFQDIRYGLRVLRKHPGFTLVAVATLALGIGANTAIFSLVNATLLSRLPVSHPESLLYVFSGGPGSGFSHPDYADVRDQNKVFDAFIVWGGITVSLNSSESDGAQLASGAIVSGDYFRTLGVNAAFGRVITPDDDKQPGGHPVVVLSHSFWQTRFGGDPQIVGRQLRLNGQPFTVIGVTPKDFGGAELGTTRGFYVPLMMQAVVRPPRGGYSGEMSPDLLNVRGNRWLYAIGRMKPGVTSRQAQQQLSGIMAQLADKYPQTNSNRVVTVIPVNDGDPVERKQLVSVATLLMAVVAAVLLIACANVANLLLARSAARRKEIAVRLALGASRWRLIRQLLTESLVLAILGATAGLLLGVWAVEGLKSAPPPAGALPITPDYAIDWRVLLFTAVLSLLAAVVFGLAPAWRASRPDLVPSLKDETKADEHSGRFNLRNLLVVSQVALSLVLLIAAGLFIRSVRQAQGIDPGFDSSKIVIAPLNINLLRYTRAQGREFYRTVVERTAALPGVESASVARIVVMSGNSSVRGLMIEGRTQTDNQLRSEGSSVTPDNDNSVYSNVVGPDYFATMGIGFFRGRDFSQADSDSSPRVLIVNEAFAQRHFRGEDAVGKRISLDGARGPWQEIVGVVRDSKYLTIGEASTPVVYRSLLQNHETGMTLHVRAKGDPVAVISAIRREVASIEPNLPMGNVRPMSELLNTSLYAARMGALLLAIFALIALILGVIGLYGVMSFSVSRRTREIGLRMALGAQATAVMRLVLKEAMMLVAVGLMIGLAAAAALTRFVSAFLYGVSPIDPLTFVGVPALLAGVAFIACYLPARRAMKIDPMLALRSQ